MEQIGLGTEIKLNIHVDPIDGLHMSDYDFSARFYTRPTKSVTVNKDEMIKIDDDNYLALVDTATMPLGVLQMVLIAFIPDSDFSDGTRTEVTPPISSNLQIVK